MFGRKGSKPSQSGAPRTGRAANSNPNPPANSNPYPIATAAKYIGAVSPGGKAFYVDGLYEPGPCFRGNEEVGVCFLFKSSEEGSGKVYYFRGFASVWIDGEPGPRPPIPTEMIANRVPGYEAALGKLFEPGGPDELLSRAKSLIPGL